MKKLLMIAIMTVAGCLLYAQDFNINVNRQVSVPVPSKNADKAIFGDNSMMDYYQAPPALRKLADSTVAFINKKSLVYDAQTKTYKVAKEIKVSSNYVDDKEDFVNQNILSFCSGAYVGKSMVLSAGHCVEPSDSSSSSYYKNVYVVFGWRYESDNTPVMSFSEDQVYTIKEVKVRELSTNISSMNDLLNKYQDYSLTVLDREPVDRKPLSVDKAPQFKVGNKAFTIGYPLGMAVKIDKPEDSQIFVVGNNTFQTNIDAFGGNSGGPVFDSSTKKIIGILVTGFGGEFDYELKQDVVLNIVITTDSATIDPQTQTLYVDASTASKLKSIITQQYKGEFVSNGQGKYKALIKSGTKINNRDTMFGIIARLFGAKALNKGKLVRYDQNDYGTGIMKVPGVILNQI